MAIEIVKQRGRAAVNIIETTVQASGLVLTVDAGVFTLGGSQYTLSDQSEHTVTPDATDETEVSGWLVQKISDSSIEVLVDETVHDGIDLPINFVAVGYTPLHQLFRVRVAANETNLSNTTINVFHVVEMEDE